MNMRKINISVPISDDVIKKINNASKNDEICVVLKNTKGLSISILDKFSDSVKFSVLGGLNPTRKKFDCEYYQSRTYYSRDDLKKIIKVFEKIERKINPLWDDFERAMFVYKAICENMTYCDGKYSRNLMGLLTGKAVCSGFALIFKEAMDRLGIECFYQNQESSHSWNVLKINNTYFGIDLTWDVCSKKNNECGFSFFGREPQRAFYDNKHHSLKYESEEDEIEYPLKELPLQYLRNTYRKISGKKIVSKKARVVNGVKTIKANIKDNPLDIVILNGIPYCKKYEYTYIRSDGRAFMVIPTGEKGKGVFEYLFLEYDKDTDYFRVTKIYSEMNLITTDKTLRGRIANNLLSRERLADRVNNYNGYVGYTNRGVNQFNMDFEREVLHIHR